MAAPFTLAMGAPFTDFLSFKCQSRVVI